MIQREQFAVIGGSGFVGSRLSKRLAENGDQFCILDKVQSSSFPDVTKITDVRDVESLKKNIPESSIIFNLAAEHRDDVTPISLYDDVNVGGAKNICDAARLKGVDKIIFTSTVAVYGFAPIGTDESGVIAPFNDYGRTKYEAEKIFVAWQQEQPEKRTLIIIRPTVIFGEKNRGNVYNLLKQISSGRFLMVGDGENRKSMAYVENISAFLHYVTNFKPGIHTYNYVDKPDFTMNHLVMTVNRMLGRKGKIKFRVPFSLGFAAGKIFDLLAWLTNKKFAVSSIRVKKFCSNSVYNTAVSESGFVPPVSMVSALEGTVKYEFLESHEGERVFYSE
ncbi:NAD-dependent epimerase/dehydratase family protein [Undibacterium jejuense]|uniref:NAD-dependent epimerase/dehydratase family protein n=1 Tax=Undibacterium jejuense TaxID=1344949 RepID=A0A923HJG9_9BURK|nr:NAD-dependent epimerase/dehydratase family protein [Undibacterium jejuense]MBC3864190.1 NAD-dependent epimerase/dehydratase family protein [Undibacterium jejuense]